jgi:hypothetical protein
MSARRIVEIKKSPTMCYTHNIALFFKICSITGEPAQFFSTTVHQRTPPTTPFVLKMYSLFTACYIFNSIENYAVTAKHKV